MGDWTQTSTGSGRQRVPRADLARSLALVSSSFPKTVLQGAQAWQLAETPHLPPIPIPRDRVCYPARPGRSSPDSAIWVKSPATGQDRPPRPGRAPKPLRPAGRTRKISSSRRLACTLIAPSPLPAQPPRDEDSGGSRGVLQPAPRLAPWARRQARPTTDSGARAAWALPWEGRRPRGGGYCGRPPRPGGGEETHRTARVPGMGRCGTGPQRGQQTRDRWGSTGSAAPILGTARGAGKRR